MLPQKHSWYSILHATSKGPVRRQPASLLDWLLPDEGRCCCCCITTATPAIFACLALNTDKVLLFVDAPSLFDWVSRRLKPNRRHSSYAAWTARTLDSISTAYDLVNRQHIAFWQQQPHRPTKQAVIRTAALSTRNWWPRIANAIYYTDPDHNTARPRARRCRTSSQAIHARWFRAAAYFIRTEVKLGVLLLYRWLVCYCCCCFTGQQQPFTFSLSATKTCKVHTHTQKCQRRVGNRAAHVINRAWQRWDPSPLGPTFRCVQKRYHFTVCCLHEQCNRCVTSARLVKGSENTFNS